MDLRAIRKTAASLTGMHGAFSSRRRSETASMEGGMNPITVDRRAESLSRLPNGALKLAARTWFEAEVHLDVIERCDPTRHARADRCRCYPIERAVDLGSSDAAAPTP